MPGFDGTGPQGLGPLTGRGLGPCGRGYAFRRGAGRWGGRRFFNWWPWRRITTPLTKEEEIAALEQELQEIQQRLKELKGQS